MTVHLQKNEKQPYHAVSPSRYMGDLLGPFRFQPFVWQKQAVEVLIN
jgi:hypothetical protein